MDYENAIKELKGDSLASTIRTLCQLQEKIRRDNFLKWIKEYPEYWMALCEMDMKDITPNYAEEVMNTLIASNMVELQMAWMFKCSNKIDIFGDAITDNDEQDIND